MTNSIYEMFKALADPTRLRIAVLLTEGELCVCDLTEVTKLPQSTVSRHMSRLKTASLVTDRRDGKWVYYRLHSDDELKAVLIELLGVIRRQSVFDDDFQKLTKHRLRKACQ